MVLQKCNTCKKNITKKSPGLECSRCSVVVHASPDCAKISNKQISSLRAAPNLEWCCEVCLSSSRRSSFFVPGDDSDNEDEPTRDADPKAVTIDVKKLLQDISIEMKKTIKEQLDAFQHSLTYNGDLIVEIEGKVDQQEAKFKIMENKNQALINQNKSLELRIAVLEQRLQESDQRLLANDLEIWGIPKEPEEDVADVVKTVATKLNVNATDAKTIKRLPGRKEKPGQIYIEMKSPEAREQWISAAKRDKLTVRDLKDIQSSSASPRDNPASANPVYIREALTIHTKTLLYNTRQQLGGTFRFIWCKDGKILCRKTDKSKIYAIRSPTDIEKLVV